MKYLYFLFLTIIATSFCEAKTYKVFKKPSSIAIAEMNGDGKPEIVLGHEVGGVGGLVSILSSNKFSP